MKCCGCEREITTGLYTGPELSFDKADFREEDLNRPRGNWGPSPLKNQFLFHTFSLEIPTDCKVKAGKLIIDVSRPSTGGLTFNDTLAITHNGGQTAQLEWVWGNNGNNGGDPSLGNLTNRTIVLDLNDDSLASVSDGSLSFTIQDDTAVLSAELKLTLCCENPRAVLVPLNSCENTEVKTEPWGAVTIPVYQPGDKIIACTEGTCGQSGYYVSLYEVDPIPWQVTTKVWAGWVCFDCEVPELLDLSKYLPPQHRSNGGFKPNTYYSFKLAVVDPWHEAYMAFFVS